MTTEQKVDLVSDIWEEYGLMPALEAVELPKSSWYYHRNEKVSYAEKYAHLHPTLEEVARQHPEYGYRRTTEEIRNNYGYVINHKVVQRLHRLWDLALLRSTRAPRPSAVRQVIREANGRANLVAALEEINLFPALRRWPKESLPHASHRPHQQVGLWLGRRGTSQHGAGTGSLGKSQALFPGIADLQQRDDNPS
jgi:hypothetical protein